MTILLIILGAVAVVIIGVLIAAAMRPDDFRIERSTTIKAAPEKVYPLINDLHKFNLWNPFNKMEPDAKGTYSGADSGKSAAYAWEGKRMGSGRMEIIDTAAPRLVVLKLDFLKPFQAHNTAEFTIVPKPEGTSVTWAMFGKSPFIPKLMGLFMSQDKMVGGAFENGLADLKAAAEN